MTLTITAAEKKALRLALHSAIEWEGSLADAHHVGYDKCDPALTRTVPAGHRAIVARCNRRIAKYRALLAKLVQTSRADKV